MADDRPSNYENATEWTGGYRIGYTNGYQDGISDGRDQGYDDAKYRIKQALEHAEAEPEIWLAVEHMVGALDDD